MKPLPLWIEAILTTALFFLAFSTPPPDVNESHYIAKAAHAWHPEGVRDDIFLDSPNAHWLSMMTFGWPAMFLSLNATTWIARWTIWILQAFAWCWMIRGLSLWPLAGLSTAAFFLTMIDVGHLSGEWAVGGAEGKGIAYAASFMAFGFAFRNQWLPTWISLGIASAWHVLIGGWITCTMLLASLFVRDACGRIGRTCIPTFIRTHRLGWAIGASIALLGLLPSWSMNRLAPDSDVQAAAFFYVFKRLPHHLSPLYFANHRWLPHLLWITSAITIGLLYRFAFHPSNPPSSVPTSNTLPTNNLPLTPLSSATNQHPLKLVWWLATGALILAAIGLAIDAWLTPRDPYAAANLLRFYWFRWNDVAWPLAVALTLATWAVPPVSPSASPYSPTRIIALSLLLLPSLAWLTHRVQHQWDAIIPNADRHALLLPDEPASKHQQVFQDWLDTCQWIRENTPPDSRWVTPQHQQSFKWYAHRWELVNWKDVPQDAHSLLEWNRRWMLCYQTQDAGRPAYFDSNTAIKLQQEFGIDYLLVDLRDSRNLPPFPWIYPEVGSFGLAARQSTFAILAIPNPSTSP